MNEILLTMIGGFFGAMCRFIISNLGKKITPNFPIGTLIVNLLGSFLLGYMVGKSVHGAHYALFGIGFMGAFTTFSTMKMDSVQLYVKHKKRMLFLYLFITYFVGIIFAFLGLLIGRAQV